jgi:hypothetical protein
MTYVMIGTPDVEEGRKEAGRLQLTLLLATRGPD